jgi:amicyanin
MHRAAFALVLACLASPLTAQSLLYRSPNFGGTWTGEGGVVHFNFLHRFYVSGDAAKKVTNFPTFTLGAGVTDRVLVGVRYASNSLLAISAPDYRPNEAEFFARWRPIGAEGDAGFGLAVTPAFNTAARSFDVEVAADYTAGPVTIGAAARVLGKPLGLDTADAKFALAAGGSFRINRYVAIGADVAQLLDADTSVVWSAGFSFLVPGSPHTFSLHASKATSTTIQGGSVNGFDKLLYGFEFTIPLHLSRFGAWFSGGKTSTGGGVAADTVHIAQLKFQTDTVRIEAGQSVRWINDDEVPHTVTFAEGAIASSGELRGGQAFTVRFDRPGIYPYTCTPHPFMRGVVVVR